MKTCLKRPEQVALYLFMKLRKMGYHIDHNRSLKSGDSWYIKVCLGTPKEPRALHLRISDHDTLPQYRGTSLYRFDICASHSRKNAISYTDFLDLFISQEEINKK